MSNESYTNFGNGTIVSKSSNVTIINNSSDSFDNIKLATQLKILQEKFSDIEKEDVYGAKLIQNAYDCANQNDISGTKNFVHKFSGFIIDLARQLSLKLLVEFILH